MREMANRNNINVSGLINHAEKKKKLALEKVDMAIKNLIKNNSMINFNSVAKESGVSKAYLYKNEEIKTRIEGIREQQKGFKNPKQVKKNMTESSKDIVIASKNKRIKELEEEVNILKNELKILRGKIYESN